MPSSFPLVDRVDPFGFNIEILDIDGNIILNRALIIYGCCCLFFAFSLLPAAWISRMVSRTYRKLPNKRVVPWLSFCMSQIHSPIAGSMALYCFWNHPWGHDGLDIFFRSNSVEVLTMLFTVSFMSVDLVVMFSHPSGFADLTALAIHHFVILWTYTACLTQHPPYGLYFALGYQAQELTVPFFTNRWFLLETGRKNTMLYVINGLAIFVLFFILRVCMGTLVCYRYYVYVPEMGPDASMVLIGAYYLVIVFELLQYYWFYGVARVVLKYFSKSKGYDELDSVGTKKTPQGKC